MDLWRWRKIGATLLVRGVGKWRAEKQGGQPLWGHKNSSGREIVCRVVILHKTILQRNRIREQAHRGVGRTSGKAQKPTD